MSYDKDDDRGRNRNPKEFQFLILSSNFVLASCHRSSSPEAIPAFHCILYLGPDYLITPRTHQQGCKGRVQRENDKMTLYGSVQYEGGVSRV